MTDTPADQPVGEPGKGAGSAAAIDPFTWHLNAMRLLESERSAAFGSLGQLQDLASQALEQKKPYVADSDPHILMQQSCQFSGHKLADLATVKVPDPEAYERAFWEAWLSQYAYGVSIGFGGYASADMTVPKEIQERLKQVAAKFNQDPEQWIQKYGTPSREKAEKEAAELNSMPRISPML